jgi:ubiquinone/menaquinone biosynthesis C-methylase UbiE
MCHFNNIEYEEEIPRHIAGYLLKKKCDKIINILDENFKNKKISGLDIGCGAGHHINYIHESANKNIKLMGLDRSEKQIKNLKKNYPNIKCYNNSMTENKFPSGHFDFIMIINSLHHLNSREEQNKALKNFSRMLKPGGLLFIHEMNVINPIVWFYLKYIFPRKNSIDIGKEIWFKERLLNKLKTFKIIKKEYFTFIPDFCPKKVFGFFKIADKVLDNSIFSFLGAHKMIVARKSTKNDV